MIRYEPIYRDETLLGDRTKRWVLAGYARQNDPPPAFAIDGREPDRAAELRAALQRELDKGVRK